MDCEQVGIAEAIDVAPLPPSEVLPSALEQGQGRTDVGIPPLLQGHVHGPAVIDPDERLAGGGDFVPGLFGDRPGGLFAIPGLFGNRPGCRLAVASFFGGDLG
jgi:hypothetical protein